MLLIRIKRYSFSFIMCLLILYMVPIGDIKFVGGISNSQGAILAVPYRGAC